MKEQRIDSREESNDALEEVFSKIQTITGEDNLDLLVTRFIQGKSVSFHIQKHHLMHFLTQWLDNLQ